MKHSSVCAALTAQFEGFSAHAYQDQNGIWTIGYGYTQDVAPGENCTREQAKEWLSQCLDQTMRQEAGDAQDLAGRRRETGDMESRQEAMDATVGQQGRELSSIQGELQVWGFLLAGFNVVGIGVTITKKKG